MKALWDILATAFGYTLTMLFMALAVVGVASAIKLCLDFLQS